jgi:hypothetical protein
MFHTFENAEAKQNAKKKNKANNDETKETTVEKYGKMTASSLAVELVNFDGESPTNNWSFKQWRQFVNTSEAFQASLIKNNVKWYDDESEHKNVKRKHFIMHQEYNYNADGPKKLDHTFVLKSNTEIQYQLYTEYDENEEEIDWKKRSQGKLTLINGKLTLSGQEPKQVKNVTYIQFLQYRNRIFKGTSFQIKGGELTTDTGDVEQGDFNTSSSLFSGNLDLKGKYKNFKGEGTITWSTGTWDKEDTFQGTFKYETYDDKRYIIGQYDPNFNYYLMSRELTLKDYKTNYNAEPLEQEFDLVPFRDIKDCRVRVMFRNFIIKTLDVPEHLGLPELTTQSKKAIKNVEEKLSE